jgi:hypothetical protein
VAFATVAVPDANMAISLNKLLKPTCIEKELLVVRNNLPMCPSGLFSCALLALVPSLLLPVAAFAGTYNRCEQDSSVDVDCLPGSGTTLLANSFKVSTDSNATVSEAVFNWKVKNCKSRTGFLRGKLTLILDNSTSALSTDPDATRSNVLNSFMQNFVRNALNSGVATTDAGYPQLALVNYNGRSGTLSTTNRVDDYNAVFTPSYCANNTPAFPAAAAYARWNETSGSGKLSICEFLPLRAASDYNAIADLQQFSTFAAAEPRGETDFTYFFRAAGSIFPTTDTGTAGRHVLLITDGLPNVPKNVPESTCKSTPRLRQEKILTGTLFNAQRNYCVDRQAVQEVARANEEALKPDYSKINFHHVLYTSARRAYFDYDNNGELKLSPADFLIENSARTGNGKVKFAYAKEESVLESELNEILEVMDANALQYVDVQVQPAGGGAALNYRAVSPAAPQQEFSIKFVGLKTGTNTVTVTSVYQDGTQSSKTFTVIAEVGAAAAVPCALAGDDKTVDGDPIGSKTPKGDGFYNKPKGNDFRDYRNADPANNLAEREFASVEDNQDSARLTKLRLQGGTGNCGVVAAATHDQGTSLSLWNLLLLLAAPLCVLGLKKRRSGGRL